MFDKTELSFAISSAILDSLIEEVAIIDNRGTVILVNAAWRDFARRAGAVEAHVTEGSDYLAALRAAASAGDSDAAATLAGIESVLSGTTDYFEHEYSCVIGGETHWFAQRVSTLRRPLGGAVIAHVDITERKLAEQERESHRFELGRAVRAATLGQLSGALAHELNQPLAAILANAQVGLEMLRRADAGDELPEILADIERDARRAGQIIERLRRMLQGRAKKMELVSLNRAVEETLAICKSELLGRKVELVTHLEMGLPPLQGDAIALQHLLLNLIVNAYEAMSDPSHARRTLCIETSMLDDGRVRVTVRDTGPGLPDVAQSKLFQPLYTTKKAGLGLGLSICRSVVEAHHGSISIASAAGGGTEVVVDLPAGGQHGAAPPS
jgi:C4-dicarboxylate-specific signal transduction histidine kinase